jgi:hypothetical protein
VTADASGRREMLIDAGRDDAVGDGDLAGAEEVGRAGVVLQPETGRHERDAVRPGRQTGERVAPVGAGRGGRHAHRGVKRGGGHAGARDGRAAGSGDDTRYRTGRGSLGGVSADRSGSSEQHEARHHRRQPPSPTASSNHPVIRLPFMRPAEHYAMPKKNPESTGGSDLVTAGGSLTVTVSPPIMNP